MTLLSVIVLFSSYTSPDFFSKQPFVLPAPSFEYINNSAPKKITLVLLQKICEQPNDIIVHAEWMKKNKLSLPLYTHLDQLDYSDSRQAKIDLRKVFLNVIPA